MENDWRCPTSSVVLPNREIISLFVSYKASPNEFYGFDHRILTEVQKFDVEINEWYAGKHTTFGFPRIPKVGTLCAAFVRERWHRVRVTSVEIDVCEAFLIDTGATAQIKLTSLCWLEDQFFWKPHSASFFSLAKSMYDWQALYKSDLILAKIEHSYGSFPVNYIITLPTETRLDDIEGCDLLTADTPDEKISEIENLNKVIANSLSIERYYAVAPKENVKISQCNSPNEFYVRFANDEEKYKCLQEKLQLLNTVTLRHTREYWTVGKKCHVRTEIPLALPKRWYRGKIQGIIDDSFEIFLRDYGHIVHTTALEDLISEDDKYETIENAAFSCSLAFIAPLNGSQWSTTSNDRFQKLLHSYDQLAVTSTQNRPQPFSQPSTYMLWGSKSAVHALEPTTQEWKIINIELAQKGIALLSNPYHISEIEGLTFDNAEYTKFSWKASEQVLRSSFDCIPTYVADDLALYFHSTEEGTLLESMRKRSIHEFKTIESNRKTQWSENDACMAKYSDDIFYRAKIMSLTGKTAEVKKQASTHIQVVPISIFSS